jgi:hypothetical protein
MDLVICALSAALSLRGCAPPRADPGQSQSGNSSLFAWDVSRRSTIAELAVWEIGPTPLSMPLETTAGAPLRAQRRIAEGGRTDRWPQITATPPRKSLQKSMIVTNLNVSMSISRLSARRWAAPDSGRRGPSSGLRRSRSDRPDPGRRQGRRSVMSFFPGKQREASRGCRGRP